MKKQKLRLVLRGYNAIKVKELVKHLHKFDPSITISNWDRRYADFITMLNVPEIRILLQNGMINQDYWPKQPPEGLPLVAMFAVSPVDCQIVPCFAIDQDCIRYNSVWDGVLLKPELMAQVGLWSMVWAFGTEPYAENLLRNLGEGKIIIENFNSLERQQKFFCSYHENVERMFSGERLEKEFGFTIGKVGH